MWLRFRAHDYIITLQRFAIISAKQYVEGMMMQACSIRTAQQNRLMQGCALLLGHNLDTDPSTYLTCRYCLTSVLYMQAKLQCTDSVDECSLPKALSQAISAAFDLSKGPLVHVTLIPLKNKQEHVLVVNMHYAVADGWSLGVLFKDISRAYNGLKHGKGNGLGYLDTV